MSAILLSPAPPPYAGTAPVSTPVSTPVSMASAASVLGPPPPDLVNVLAPSQEAAGATGSPVAAAAATPDTEAAGATNLHDEDYAQDVPAEPLVLEPLPAPASGQPLDNEEAFRIAMTVADGWSGTDGWAAVGEDLEARSHGSDATSARHLGLGFGLLLFTQESGLLGEVLRLFRERDPDAWGQAFGSDAAALLATLTAGVAEQRLAPVGGSLVWEAPWPERFRGAGGLPPCQYAQNEVAVERVVRPTADLALALGLTTDRGLAMAVDFVVAGGVGRGLHRLVAAACPFTSSTDIEEAMRSVGCADVAAVQARADVPRTGLWDPATVAGLMSLRREAGLDRAGSEELQGRLISRSSGPRRDRLRALRSSTTLDDRHLSRSAG
jgi:hypothetical protein